MFHEIFLMMVYIRSFFTRPIYILSKNDAIQHNFKSYLSYTPFGDIQKFDEVIWLRSFRNLELWNLKSFVCDFTVAYVVIIPNCKWLVGKRLTFFTGQCSKKRGAFVRCPHLSIIKYAYAISLIIPMQKPLLRQWYSEYAILQIIHHKLSTIIINNYACVKEHFKIFTRLNEWKFNGVVYYA